MSVTIGALVLLGLAPRLSVAAETLLVLHKWSETLGAYDPVSGARLGVLPVGTIPHEMVLSKDGRELYVTNYGVRRWTDEAPGGNTITVVDLSSGWRAAVIDLGNHRRPHGIERGTSGRLYVTTDHPAAVLAVDPAARRVARAYPLDQRLPHMLALTRDETTAWVANSGSASVSMLNLATGASASITVGGVPMGLTLSPDEKRLLVANRSGDAVVVVDTRARKVKARITIAGAPARVEWVPGTQRAIVALVDAGQVVLVDTDRLRVVRKVTVGAHPEGLLPEHDGKVVFSSAQGEDKVVKLSLPSGKKLLEFATESRPDPMVLVPGRIALRTTAPHEEKAR